MRHGPKRLKKAAGFTMDPITKEWRPKFPKPVPDPIERAKVIKAVEEAKNLPTPEEEKPFDWSKYQPLPGRVLLRVGAEIQVEKGVVIPDAHRIREEWLEVVAVGPDANCAVGDRVFVEKNAHRMPLDIEGKEGYVLVKTRHIAAILQ